jgi:hypothetical protein
MTNWLDNHKIWQDNLLALKRRHYSGSCDYPHAPLDNCPDEKCGAYRLEAAVGKIEYETGAMAASGIIRTKYGWQG